ncbi:MAG: hypothetical protein HGA66_14710 [Holophaga sp.]|nr:hypothetical protein [Holophaga sp.]
MCGLAVQRRPLPRPLLFQASALSGVTAQPREERQGISAPALGRVEPLTILEPMEALPDAAPSLPELPGRPAPDLDLLDSFWPVVKMEAGEFAALAALNAFLVLVACLASGAGPSRVYAEFWAYLLPVHTTISWAFLMVPLVLVGQSPLMGVLRLAVDTDQPERRMAFSLLYLVSAGAFPLSFLCMVLTPDHRTLAELLSGREILQMPYARMR